MKSYRSLIVLLALLALTPASVRSAVTLSLVNTSNTSSSTVNVTAGSSFSASVLVEGLSASQSLDLYGVQIAALPAGVTLSAITNPLSNWSIGPNLSTNYCYGMANSTSDDLSSATIVLLNYTFNTSVALGSGSYTLSFTNDSNTALYDSALSPIGYTSANLQLSVAPEPTGLTLFASCTLLLLLTGARRRHNCVAAPQ